jgi:hypothetical protein
MSARSPRGGNKVGPSRAPEPNCGPGQYAWRNFFASGCKPANEDRRSEARQFRNVRRGGAGAGAAPIEADGWGYGSYNGYDSYDNYNGYNGYGSYDGLYGVSSGRKSGRRNYGSSSGRRNYGASSGSRRQVYGSARRY